MEYCDLLMSESDISLRWQRSGGASIFWADEICHDFDRTFICWLWNLFFSPLPSLPIRLFWDTDGDLGECCCLLISNLVADGHCDLWELLRGGTIKGLKGLCLPIHSEVIHALLP